MLALKMTLCPGKLGHVKTLVTVGKFPGLEI